MKLLIVTQVVDEEDPILGFFIAWIRKFSEHTERIDVICMRKGKYILPENVYVYSLGKENGAGKITRLIRYLSLLYSLRKEHTHVFAHMSPEYVLTGWPIWFAFGKKVALWYNHSQKSVRLSLAAYLVDAVFYTSPYAASARFSNSRQMPAGIDTDLFCSAHVSKNPLSVYFQGRVAPAKRVGEMCEAIQKLRTEGIQAEFDIVGPENASYGEELRRKYRGLVNDGSLNFLGPKKPLETPVLYSKARVSVNLTAPGNYDKTVLESMACETPVIVSSPAFADLIPKEWIVPEHDASAFAEKIKDMFALSESEYYRLGVLLREVVVKKQSLSKLAGVLFPVLSSL